MSARVDVVDPGVVRIGLPGTAANAYLFFGKRLALVDCGSEETLPALNAALRELEVPRRLVSLVVLTHEHEGHAGAAAAFPDALVAAHPLAAAKLRYPTDGGPVLRHADIELEEGSALHLGGFSFRILHTPGHSSGSICLYERARRLLVTGDTALARGGARPTSNGSRGELCESLERLAAIQARVMLPGHGLVSEDPFGDLTTALGEAA